MTCNCEISQRKCIFVVTFILKIFIQKPDDGPRGLKYAAYL